MHVEFTAAAEEWGGWRLGDLAVAVCRAVEAVGPAADVVSLSVRQPDLGPASVSLWVTDREEMQRLRYETESGEYVASGWRADDVGWRAVVNGVSLMVTAERRQS